MNKEEYDKYYKNNEMYNYLEEHTYISHNKKSNYQSELSIPRAECIANKYNSLTKELKQENKQLNRKIDTLAFWINETINTIEEQPTGNNEYILTRLYSFMSILGDKE